MTAIVLINTDGSAVEETAQELAEMEGVAHVYSVTGPYDIVATIRAKDDEEMAGLVTGPLMRLEAIRKTITLIAIEKYGTEDLEHIFSIGFQGR